MAKLQGSNWCPPKNGNMLGATNELQISFAELYIKMEIQKIVPEYRTSCKCLPTNTAQLLRKLNTTYHRVNVTSDILTIDVFENIYPYQQTTRKR